MSVSQGETRSHRDQLAHLPWTQLGRTGGWAHSACGQWEAGRGQAGCMVYVDSFRHVTYNTLWTSNRLIKYILYKYISYCTRCPLVQPLDSVPHTQAQVPQAEPWCRLASLLILQACHLYTGGPRDAQEYCFHKAQTQQRLMNHLSTTFSQCLLPWGYAVNGQKGETEKKPPSFTGIMLHALRTKRHKGACLGRWPWAFAKVRWDCRPSLRPGYIFRSHCLWPALLPETWTKVSRSRPHPASCPDSLPRVTGSPGSRGLGDALPPEQGQSKRRWALHRSGRQGPGPSLFCGAVDRRAAHTPGPRSNPPALSLGGPPTRGDGRVMRGRGS